MARFQTGDLSGAIQDCTEAIRLSPNYAAAYHNRSLARNALHDPVGAKQDREQAIRLGFKP